MISWGGGNFLGFFPIIVKKTQPKPNQNPKNPTQKCKQLFGAKR